MIFPQWRVRLSEECLKQRDELVRELLVEIRAGAFASRPASVVEPLYAKLDALETLVKIAEDLQSIDRDPRTIPDILKPRASGDSELELYVLEFQGWRCVYERDPVARVAKSLFICDMKDRRGLDALLNASSG